MSKYFIFMFIEDPVLRKFLNLAIFALNPLEKWPAHVTLAGPFKEKIELPRSLKFVQQISILGRGRFLNGSRHTIYLHAGSRDIQSRMEKPDFPSAIPHLSLYSGNNGELADLLYEKLGEIGLFGVFYNKKLQVVESNEQYNFNFRTQIDASISPLSAGKSLEEIRKLSLEMRVELAVDAIRRGLAYSARSTARKIANLSADSRISR